MKNYCSHVTCEIRYKEIRRTSAIHKMRMKRRQGWVTRQIEKIKEENVCIHIFIGGEDQQ